MTTDENELKAEDFPALGLKVVRWAEEATTLLGGVPYPLDLYKQPASASPIRPRNTATASEAVYPAEPD